MAASLRYLKSVRTRYRNVLTEEIKNCESIKEETDDSEKDEILSKINKCLQKLEVYHEKTEKQSKELCSAIGDTDDHLLDEVIEEDSALCEKALECCIDLKEYKCKLENNIKEEKNVKETMSETKTLVDLQNNMHQMVVHQMQQQREFFERHEKQSNGRVTVNLPKLELVSFNGDKLKWTEFWDSFESAVHKNDNLSGIEKMNYLTSKLTGDAKAAVTGLALSNENYNMAVNLLRDRFGKLQDVIDLHYSCLINIKAPMNTKVNLRAFLDEVEKHLRSLEVLKQNVNQDVFVSMIKAKLPRNVLVQLEMQKEEEESWTTGKLRDRLRHYVTALESSEIAPVKTTIENKQMPRETRIAPVRNFNSGANAPTRYTSSAEALVSSDKQSNTKYQAKQCRYCKKQHYSDECENFKTVNQRKTQIKGSCFRCLREGHMATDCKWTRTCVYCGEINKHHRSLCPKVFSTSVVNEVTHVSNEIDQSEQEFISEENSLVSFGEMVLMQTAMVGIKNPNSQKCLNTRLLLDSGSQRTYITESLAQRLGLKREGEQELRLSTFGSDKTKVVKTFTTSISLKVNDGSYMKVTANIVPVISGNIVRRKLNKGLLDQADDLLKSVKLADTLPNEDQSSSIELLIGNDYYLDIVLPQRIQVKDGLFLLGSKFGWILTGRIETTKDNSNETSLLILSYGSNVTKTEVFQSIDDSIPIKPDLEDFWNVESLGITDSYNKSGDDIAMEMFKRTLVRENNRYQVVWPWKENALDLPKNRELAIGRLRSNAKKLNRNPELMRTYDSVFKNQLEQGIIESVERYESDGLVHYIPHHGIVNPHKTTTKLRVVYDASAKSKESNKSLNEHLLRGPVLLHNLCGLLMRFRLHKIVLVADIEKAFLQIGLQPCERDVTRFLWLKNYQSTDLSEDNIQEFRFCRVPFGIISSPFLLAATVEHHLENYNTTVSKRLKDDIYVDNVITGADSEADAIELYKESKKIFRDASMNLREWLSNNDTVNSEIEAKEISRTLKAFSDSESVLESTRVKYIPITEPISEPDSITYEWDSISAMLQDISETELRSQTAMNENCNYLEQLCTGDDEQYYTSEINVANREGYMDNRIGEGSSENDDTTVPMETKDDPLDIPFETEEENLCRTVEQSRLKFQTQVCVMKLTKRTGYLEEQCVFEDIQMEQDVFEYFD